MRHMNFYNPIPLDKDKSWYWWLDPNGQISGPRGSGKTFMIYYVLLSFAKRGADIYICDPKRSDLSSLRFCFPEHLQDSHVATTPGKICKILRELTETMNQRYEDYFTTDTLEIGSTALEANLRPVVVFIDEILALVEEDSKIAKEVEIYLKQIILKGRQAGIYAIISSQRLATDTLNGVIRENCGLRILLGKVQAESYKMGLGFSEAELPRARTGTGQGYIFLDGQGWAVPKAFEVPYIDTKKLDIRKVLSKYLALNSN